MKSHPSYRPIIPHPKIVRTRGAINETHLVVIWLWWAWCVRLPF